MEELRTISRLFIILFCILMMQTGCKVSDLAPVNYMSFKPVENFTSFTVPEPGAIVIRDKGRWLSFWEQYWSTYLADGKKSPPPAVDFDSKMVIGIFWGGECKYSGCTPASPSIRKIVMYKDKIEVTVGAIAFLGYCDMCVSPLFMVIVDHSDLPVFFIGQTPLLKME